MQITEHRTLSMSEWLHFYDFNSTEVRCRIFSQEKSAFTTIFLTKIVWHLFSFDEASAVTIQRQKCKTFPQKSTMTTIFSPHKMIGICSVIHQQSNYLKTKMQDFFRRRSQQWLPFFFSFTKWLVFVQFRWSDQMSSSTNNITTPQLRGSWSY